MSKRIGCGLCGRAVVAKGLCATHYQSQRRREQGVRPRENFGDEAKFRLSPTVAMLVEALALREGITVSEWHRRAVEERCNRMVPGGEWRGPLPKDG